MSQRNCGGIQRSALTWALAAGVITALTVLILFGWAERRAETRETIEGLCARVVQRAHPGSDVDVTSTERVRTTQYLVSGTLTYGQTSPEAFDCVAYSDLHGGWGAEMGDTVTPK